MIPVTSSQILIICATMMNTPETGAMLYTRLLDMPSRAENSFLALIASLAPPTVRIVRAKANIYASMNISRSLLFSGVILLWSKSRAICCLVQNP